MKSISYIELRSALFILLVLFGTTRLVQVPGQSRTGSGPDAGDSATSSVGTSSTGTTDALLTRAQRLDPDDLMNLADDALFPESFVATMRMTTVRPNRRTTEMVLENSHLDDAGTFMEVVEPRRSAGMRFLQKNEDLWMYNPRASSRRALRLSPRDSFQGSVFSNNDVSDPDYSDDYNAEIAGTEPLTHAEVGTVTTIRIDATASHDESAYGRIEMWLWPDPHAGAGSGVAGTGSGGAGAGSTIGGAGASTDTAGGVRVIPLRIDYYSRSGLLFKRMTLSDIQPLAGARRPTVMEMASLEEEGAVTTVVIQSLEARDNLPTRLFSQQELTR